MGIIYLILIVVVITELFVSGQWVSFYFRTGIPLFRRTFQFPERPIISPKNLSEIFRSWLTNPLVFHEISPDEICFREQFFSFRFFYYTPIMHGLIRIDSTRQEVSVTGYANWFVPCFTGICILEEAAFTLKDSGTSIFLFVLLAILYLIQLTRFNKVFGLLKSEHSENTQPT